MKTWSANWQKCILSVWWNWSWNVKFEIL
jgi:hypothetical protein